MRQITIALFLLMLTLRTFAQETGDGIRFIEGEPWANVLRMAQEQDKYIFMDCYTSWCGPCKALAKDVFTRKEAGEFFNAHFINVKYDMEKGEGKTLRKMFQANIIGYPTLLLISKDGKVVHQMAGYHEADALISGMKAGMEGKNLFAYRDRYEAGERSLEFIRDYVGALEGAFMKDEMQKVVTDYMKSIPVEKLKEKEVWELVGDYVKDPYSPQFEYVVFNLDYFPLRLKADRYQLERQLNWALERAVDEIVELKRDEAGKVLPLTAQPENMQTLLKLINRANLRRAETYRAKMKIHELELAARWNEVYDYLVLAREIGALGYSDRFLGEVVHYMALNCKDRRLLKDCLALMEDLQAREDQKESRMKSYYYDTLALLQERLGDKKQAAVYREKDKELKQKKAKEFEEFMKNAK